MNAKQFFKEIEALVSEVEAAETVGRIYAEDRVNLEADVLDLLLGDGKTVADGLLDRIAALEERFHDAPDDGDVEAESEPFKNETKLNEFDSEVEQAQLSARIISAVKADPSPEGLRAVAKEFGKPDIVAAAKSEGISSKGREMQILQAMAKTYMNRERKPS